MTHHDKIFSVQNLLFPSFSSNPDGISGDLLFKGCKRHCKGCHNLELQEFAPPDTSVNDIIRAIKANDIHILTLMGGEPLDQDIKALRYLICSVKDEVKGLKVSLYTGNEFEEIPEEILELVDYVKTGRYDEDNLSNGDYFLASYNQRFYKRANSGFTLYVP